MVTFALDKSISEEINPEFPEVNRSNVRTKLARIFFLKRHISTTNTIFLT